MQNGCSLPAISGGYTNVKMQIVFDLFSGIENCTKEDIVGRRRREMRLDLTFFIHE